MKTRCTTILMCLSLMLVQDALAQCGDPLSVNGNGGVTSTCPGTALELQLIGTPSGSTQIWRKDSPSGPILQTCNCNTLIISQPGTYYAANQCNGSTSNYVSITITQPSGCSGGCSSSTPSINASPGTACSGDLVSLTAGGCDNGTLTWQHNGATGTSTTANGPGTYVVKCKQGTCTETQNQVTVNNCNNNNQQNPGFWETMSGSNRIRNTNGGPVVIGDGIGNFPGNYKLYVADGIMTERLKVAIRNSGNWADFVFDPAYRLPDLRDVSRYVQQKGHLPGIPSASEVTQQGLDVAEMNARLLQKIEELTLYVIKQDAALRRLKREVQGLRNHKTR